MKIVNSDDVSLLFYDENNLWLYKRTEAETKFEKENFSHKINLPSQIEFGNYLTKDNMRIEEHIIL